MDRMERIRRVAKLVTASAVARPLADTPEERWVSSIVDVLDALAEVDAAERAAKGEKGCPVCDLDKLTGSMDAFALGVALGSIFGEKVAMVADLCCERHRPLYGEAFVRVQGVVGG